MSDQPGSSGPHPDSAAADGPRAAPGSGATAGPERADRTSRWRAFRESPFYAAVTVTLILAAAAGLFAGSYTYAMADPTPRQVPAAVVGQPAGSGDGARFAGGLERALGSSLDLRRYPDFARAREAVEAQQVFAILNLPSSGGVRLDVVSATGASVAEVLEKAAPKVGREAGVRVTVRDLKPLDEGDPRGLALFYISLAAVIVGFVGAIQLSVHASGLNPLERIGFTAAYALLGGFVICATENWVLGSVQLPFVHSWMILALTMFTSGMVFTMFNTLLGRWAMLPTWGLMVILGNPSSGGAVSWPLLPSVLGEIGRWLPPGASVNAQHTAVYFPGHQHLQPYLVLAAWALVSTAVFWTWRHRHPGGREPRATGPARDPEPPTAAAPAGG